MSEQDFESYLRLLSRFLRLSEDQRVSIRCELRDHLEQRLDELLATGMDRERAVLAALDEFGDAASLAHEFDRIGRRRKWIMRSTIGALSLTCVILIVGSLLPSGRYSPTSPLIGVAEQVSSPTTKPSRTAKPAAIAAIAAKPDPNEALRKKLDKVVPDLNVTDMPFEDAIDFIRTTGDICVDVNWKTMERQGIEKTSPVSLNLREVKYSTILNLLLQNVGEPEAPIGYAFMDGIIRISTEEDLERQTEIRVYDCQDLIGRARASDVQERLNNVLRDKPSQGMGGGFGLDSQATPPLEQSMATAIASMRKEAAAALIELIKSNIAPGSWAPDGAIGSIGEYDGLLVVRHNARVHENLVAMLEMLRQAKTARGTAAVASNTAPVESMR